MKIKDGCHLSKLQRRIIRNNSSWYPFLPIFCIWITLKWILTFRCMHTGFIKLFVALYLIPMICGSFNKIWYSLTEIKMQTWRNEQGILILILKSPFSIDFHVKITNMWWFLLIWYYTKSSKSLDKLAIIAIIYPHSTVIQ